MLVTHQNRDPESCQRPRVEVNNDFPYRSEEESFIHAEKPSKSRRYVTKNHFFHEYWSLDWEARLSKFLKLSYGKSRTSVSMIRKSFAPDRCAIIYLC